MVFIEMKDLIILGMGPSAWQCPWDSEVWGLNMGWELAQKDGHQLDKLFLAHGQVYSKEGNPYFDWQKINQQSFEVMSVHRIKGLKSTIFPLKRINQKFGTDYYSNTVCYMLAYALDKSTDAVLRLKPDAYTRIRFYGVDILEDEEISQEKAGIEYWLGIARGLGIKCEISYNSTLLRTERPKLPVTLLNKGCRDDGNVITGILEIVAQDLNQITHENLIKALGG